MRLLAPASLLLLVAFSACLESEADESVDTTRPVIGPAAGSQGVIPGHFLEVGPAATHIPLAFEVTDDREISEIAIETHNGFDGHLHGRGPTGSDFVLLNFRQTLLAEDFADSTRFETRADDTLSIFLDERNGLIPAGSRVLAGPYHFSVKAVDASGNETSYDDNSTYHSTLLVQRSHAPAVEVMAVDRVGGLGARDSRAQHRRRSLLRAGLPLGGRRAPGSIAARAGGGVPGGVALGQLQLATLVQGRQRCPTAESDRHRPRRSTNWRNRHPKHGPRRSAAGLGRGQERQHHTKNLQLTPSNCFQLLSDE